MGYGTDEAEILKELSICSYSQLCDSQKRNAFRGDGFTWIDVLNVEGKVRDAFEVLSVGHEAKDLTNVSQNPLGIRSLLTLIRKYQTMAFTKNSDLFSINLANAFRENKAFRRFNLYFKMHTKGGGVRIQDSIAMINVGILDFKGRIRQDGSDGIDIVEITCDQVSDPGGMFSGLAKVLDT